MASKKKNKRAVLVTSCILAALIVAGSTFAWFTSTDDVTNRLTSTANYGVSIVESFTPPANWIPGQEVNKDVYAVNTGSIAAFVREDVSGVLSFTYEKLAASFPSDATKAVELDKTTKDSIDGVTTMEAGAYLAWTNTNESLGEKAIDHTHGTGWKPNTDGIYIFRRSIGGEKFTYSGYYYKDGKYYKIVIGSDLYPTATGAATMKETDKNVFDVNVSSDNLGVAFDPDTGIITETPVINYAVEAKVENNAVTMVYQQADADHGDRLEINFVADMYQLGGTSGYDASAVAARAEVDYYNALGDSNDATAEYNQAKADYDYAVALAEARDTLYAAARQRADIADAQTTADTNNDNARTAVNTAAGVLETSYTDLLGTMNPAINKKTIVPEEVRTSITTNASLTQAQANLTALDSLWDNRISADITAINTAIGTLKGGSVSAADAANAAQTLKEKAADLKTALGLYKDKYAELVSLATNSNITGLGMETSGTHKTNIGTQLTAATNLDTAINTAATGIVALSDDYTAKAAAKATADGNTSAANTAWANAVAAYNNAVGIPSNSTTNPATEATGATLAYETALENAETAATTGRVTIVNNASTLVPQYSANTTASGTSPAIDASADYTTYSTITSPAQPSNSDVTTKETTMGQKEDIATQKEGVYNDAKAVLTQTSTITIYVNLAENYSQNWQFDTSTTNSEKASFYLKSILDAGKTSKMLIDSVVLADTVTAGQYKDMTFDLNVGLKSAQVAYADDQVTVVPTAANGSGDFDMTATVDADNTTVSWS